MGTRTCDEPSSFTSRSITESEYLHALETDIRAEVRKRSDLSRIRREYDGFDWVDPRPTRLSPQTSVGAVSEIFAAARPSDFYPLLESVIRDGDKMTLPFKAVLHSQRAQHDEHQARANSITYINLVSYRPIAIKANGKFNFRKQDAFAVHGVFIDFDGGRAIGDEKWLEPGHLLAQRDVRREIDHLAEAGIIPPFQIWVDGTRGCYGIYLFETPEMNIHLAAEMWRNVRGYLYRRLKLLGADEGARAITQPLKAPGTASGKVCYYRTDADRTSLERLLSFFRDHPHWTDLDQIASPRLPFDTKHAERLQVASDKCLQFSIPKKSSSTTRNMTPEQKVGWLTARIRDWYTFVKAFRKTGYSRRQFFLDVGSAVKQQQYGLHGDSKRAFEEALRVARELNSCLERPLSDSKLREQIIAADPEANRTSESIRLDMEITEKIASDLNLTALVPASLKAEWRVQEVEARARRAEETFQRRAMKAKKKEEANYARGANKEARQVARRTAKEANDERKAKRHQQTETVIAMLLAGEPTSLIMEIVGIHQQTVSRIRKRLVAEGRVLPEQRRARRGPKKRHTVTPRF